MFKGAGGEKRRTNLNSFENRLKNQMKAKRMAKTPVGSSRGSSKPVNNQHRQAVNKSSMSIGNFLKNAIWTNMTFDC